MSRENNGTINEKKREKKQRNKKDLEESNTNEFQANKEHQRIDSILKNLNISFKSCTFTYKLEHIQKEDKKCGKRPSRFRATLTNTLERVKAVVTDEQIEFKNPIFVPKNLADDVQAFVRKEFSDGCIIKFENCKFLQRGSSFFEKVSRRLRNLFGIIFEMTYPDCKATVEEYVFRLKDIGVVSAYVQERILEKG